MHECGFEQVVLDFVFVGDGPDDVRADVAFVVEGFEAAPNAGVFVFGESGLRGGGGAEGVVEGGGGVRVDPLFDFDGAGAVVEFVGYVCGLGGYVADLSDEGDLLWGALVR